MRFRAALAVLAVALGALAMSGCRNGPFWRPTYYYQPVPQCQCQAVPQAQPVTQCQPTACCPQ
jgi:hypothetical protein